MRVIFRRSGLRLLIMDRLVESSDFFFGSGKENEVVGFVVFSQKLLIGYFM